MKVLQRVSAFAGALVCATVALAFATATIWLVIPTDGSGPIVEAPALAWITAALAFGFGATTRWLLEHR